MAGTAGPSDAARSFSPPPPAQPGPAGPPAAETAERGSAAPQQPDVAQTDLPFFDAEAEAEQAEDDGADDLALAAAAGLIADEPLAFDTAASGPAEEQPADTAPSADPAAGFPPQDLDPAAKLVDALQFASGFDAAGAESDAETEPQAAVEAEETTDPQPAGEAAPAPQEDAGADAAPAVDLQPELKPGRAAEDAVDAAFIAETFPASVSATAAGTETGDRHEPAASMPEAAPVSDLDTPPDSPAPAGPTAEAAPEPPAQAALRPGVLAHLAAVRRLPPQALADASACAEALRAFAHRG
ncbi:hypothetical protein [Cribrihabitans pelagius]|uniref:hypothetical protein n=1 Tax=Cribrihabitans pelagius TaxID=1765746 RepID=UPI003B59E19C